MPYSADSVRLCQLQAGERSAYGGDVSLLIDAATWTAAWEAKIP